MDFFIQCLLLFTYSHFLIKVWLTWSYLPIDSVVREYKSHLLIPHILWGHANGGPNAIVYVFCLYCSDFWDGPKKPFEDNRRILNLFALLICLLFHCCYKRNPLLVERLNTKSIIEKFLKSKTMFYYYSYYCRKCFYPKYKIISSLGMEH